MGGLLIFTTISPHNLCHLYDQQGTLPARSKTQRGHFLTDLIQTIKCNHGRLACLIHGLELLVQGTHLVIFGLVFRAHWRSFTTPLISGLGRY